MEKNIEGKWFLKEIYRITKKTTEGTFVENQEEAFFLKKGDVVYIKETDKYKDAHLKTYLFYDDELRTINERLIKPIKKEISNESIVFEAWGSILVFYLIVE